MNQVIRRAALNFVYSVLVLTGLLFIPSQTLKWPAAWIFLCTFSLSNILINLYLIKKRPDLLERRQRIGPTAEKFREQKVIQLLAFLLFAGIIATAALDHRFSWSTHSFWQIVLGNAVATLGFSLRFLVFKANEFASATIEVDLKQAVVDSGTYSVIRHPMYLSTLIILFGAALALESMIATLVWIPLVFTIAWRTTAEEKFLLQSLPGYGDYTKKARYRLVPYIW